MDEQAHTLSERAASIWAALVKLASGETADFLALGRVDQMGMVVAILIVLVASWLCLRAIWRLVTLPVRKRQASATGAERKAAPADRPAAAPVRQAAAQQTTIKSEPPVQGPQVEASPVAPEALTELIARLLAREAAASPKADAAALQQIETAATGIANAGGEAARAALELIAEGDESGFDTLAALAGTDERATAATWRSIGQLAFLNYPQKALGAWQKVVALLPEDAEAWNVIGLLHKRLGELDEAADAFQRVDALAGDDQHLRLVALAQLGQFALTRGDLETAAEFHERSLDINTTLGRKGGMANQLANLGLIAMKRNDADRAEDFYTRALTLYETVDRKQGIADILNSLGTIARTRGNLDAAESFYKRSLELEEALERKEGMANQFGNLGLIAKDRGNLPEASRLWEEALRLYRELRKPKKIELVERWIEQAGTRTP